MPRFYLRDQDLGEFDEFTNKEWSRLKKVAGISPKDFDDENDDADPIQALTGIVYILRRRMGEDALRWDDVEFKPSEIRQELSEEEKAKAAEDQADSIEPVMRRICQRIGIDLDDDKIRAIAVEEWLAGQEAGKDAAPPGELL